MKLVTVYRTFNPADADVIYSVLEAANFDVVRTHDTAARLMEGYALAAGGILLEVPEDQASDARELLASAADIPPGS